MEEQDDDNDRWQKMILQLVQPLQDNTTTPISTIMIINQNNEKQLMIESIVDDAYTMYERLDLQQNYSYRSTGNTDDDYDMNYSNNNSEDQLQSQNSGTQEEAVTATSSLSVASQVEFILQQLYIGCRNPQLPVRDRRKAFVALQKLLQSLQKFICLHPPSKKKNHENNQCRSLEAPVLPAEYIPILQASVTDIQASSKHSNLTNLEEANGVHSTTLPQVLPQPSIIDVDGSSYIAQSTAIHTIHDENEAANDVSNIHLLVQQPHHSSSFTIAGSHETIGNEDMTMQRTLTSDELLKAIFDGSSFVPEMVGEPNKPVPTLHNQAFAAVSHVLDHSSATAATVKKIAHDSYVASQLAQVSESNSSVDDNIAKNATKVTALNTGSDAVVEDLMSITKITTMSSASRTPPNQINQSDNLYQELCFTGSQTLPSNSAAASNDCDYNLKDRNIDKDQNNEFIVTENVCDMDTDVNKNDDDQYPANDDGY